MKQRHLLVALMTAAGDDPTFAWKITSRTDMSEAIDAYLRAPNKRRVPAK